MLKIKNLISIKGNHDDWFLTFLNTGVHSVGWKHGGNKTLESYCEYSDKVYDKTDSGYITSLNPEDIPVSHINFFRKQLYYYIHNNKLFVHGGFNRHFSLKEQYAPSIFYWDRDLWHTALSYESMSEESKSQNPFRMKDNFEEIYIGHTKTTHWFEDEEVTKDGILINLGVKPITHYMKAANIYNIDTGGGWYNGRLCMIDINTKEAFYSDLGKDLYPNEQGRKIKE